MVLDDSHFRNFKIPPPVKWEQQKHSRVAWRIIEIMNVRHLAQGLLCIKSSTKRKETQKKPEEERGTTSHYLSKKKEKVLWKTTVRILKVIEEHSSCIRNSQPQPNPIGYLSCDLGLLHAESY